MAKGDRDPDFPERVAAIRRNLQERKERARNNLAQSLAKAEPPQPPLRQLLTHLHMQWREPPIAEPLPEPIAANEKSGQLEESV